MNKVLVKIYVPIIESEYDVWLPINRKLYKISISLKKSINELCGGYYTPSKMPILYDKDSAQPYNMNLNVKDNNIKNGTEIILI